MTMKKGAWVVAIVIVISFCFLLAEAQKTNAFQDLINKEGKPIALYGIDIFHHRTSFVASSQKILKQEDTYDMILEAVDKNNLQKFIPKKKKKILSLQGKTYLIYKDITPTEAQQLPTQFFQEVKSIEVYPKFHAFLDVSNELIQANQTKQVQVQNTFINGTGETVCIIDSGVDYTHSSLGGCFGPGCIVIGGYDFVNNDTDPKDDFGHGTHVAGIIASQDRTYQGIAPGAKIIAIKVLNSSGRGDADAIIKGIEWCTNNASKYNITVISMSLGTTQRYSSYCDDSYPLLAAAINNAIAKNISVVVASGNDYDQEAISSPACIKNTTSVGATDKNKVVADYSNIASILDVLAPGSSIYSTYLNNQFIAMSGTSMATPHVSAGIALLREFVRLNDNGENPINYTPAYYEEQLKTNGQLIAAGSYQIPFIQLYDTLQAINNSFPLRIENFTPPNATHQWGNITFHVTANRALQNATLWLNITNKSYTMHVIPSNTSCNDCSWQKNLTINITPPQSYTLLLTITDIYNQTKNATYSYSSNILTLSMPPTMLINSLNPNITINASSNYNDFVKYTLWLNGSNSQNGTCNVSDQRCEINSDLPEGHWNMTIAIYDDTNYTINQSTNLTIDKTVPIIKYTLSKHIFTNNSRIVIIVNASDTFGIKNISLMLTSLGGNGTLNNDTFQLTAFNQTTTQGILNTTWDISASGIMRCTLQSTDTNNNTNASISFNVSLDITPPQLVNVTSLLNANETTNITFVINETHLLNRSNVTINDVIYTNFTNGTTTLILPLRSGSYEALFHLIDEVNQTTITRFPFTVLRKENFSEIAQEIKEQFVNATFYLNDTPLMNKTFPNKTLKLILNDSQTTIILPEVNGSSIQYNKTKAFLYENKTNCTEAQAVRETYSLAITTFSFFKNFSRFMPSLNYGKVIIHKTQAQMNRTLIIYIANDNGTNTSFVQQCSNITQQVFKEKEACYSYDQEILTIYVPHFSGIALGEDTLSPNLTLYEPGNATILNTSNVFFNISVKEFQPNETFCFLNITKQEGSQNKTYFIKTFMKTDFINKSYNFTNTSLFYNFTNGTYFLFVSCSDSKNQTANKTLRFFINDSKAPGGTVRNTTTATTANLFFNTTEYSNYTASFGSPLNQQLKNMTFRLQHILLLTNLSSGTTYHFNLTLCDVNGNCNTTHDHHFTTETTTTTTTTTTLTSHSSGGGGSRSSSSSISSSSAKESTKKTILLLGNYKEIKTQFHNLHLSLHFNKLIKNPEITLIKKTTIEEKPHLSTHETILDAYEIYPLTINPEEINNYTFSIALNKSVLNTQNISAVSLYKKSENETQWKKYCMQKAKENQTTILYQVTLSSFSLYLIIGEQALPTTTQTTTTTIRSSTTTSSTTTIPTKPTILTQNETPSNDLLNNQKHRNSESKGKKDNNQSIMIIIVIIISLLLSIVLLFLRKRKPKKEKKKT